MALMHRTWYYSPQGEGLFHSVENVFFEWLSTRRGVTGVEELGTDGKYKDLGGGHKARRDFIELGKNKYAEYLHTVTNQEGTYSSKITVARLENEAWVKIEVNAPREDSAFASPLWPRMLIRNCFENKISVYSGSIHNRLTEGFQVRRVDDIGEFIDDVLESEARNTSAIVVGASNFHNFNQQLKWFEKYVERSVGVSSLWFLDADATEEFNYLVPKEYSVFPSSIRVFQPSLDTTNISDSWRHRYITNRQLLSPRIGYIKNKLYHLSREAALRQPVPKELEEATGILSAHVHNLRLSIGSVSIPKPKPVVERVGEVQGKTQDLLKKAESLSTDRLLPDAHKADVAIALPYKVKEVEPQPQLEEKKEDLPRLEVSVSSAPSEITFGAKLKESIDVVAGILGLSLTNFTNAEDLVYAIGDFASSAMDRVSELEAYANELQVEKEQLKQEVAEEGADYERVFAELDELEHEELRLRKENQYLRFQLQRMRAPSEAYFMPEEEQPQSIGEILERLETGAVKNVVFTGDKKDAIVLDERITADSIARFTWQVIKALAEYCQLPQNERKSVDRYLKLNSALIPARRHARDETHSVKATPEFAKHRRLPVPTTIEESGFVDMWAHFKLGSDGGKAPRLHYFDATDIDGKVYIGYIGAHLQSRRTT